MLGAKLINALVGILLVVLIVACGNAPTVLVDASVTVAGGGGGAQVSFKTSTQVQIEIALNASNTTMMPYGFLEFPDGTGEYYPPLEQAKNGTNVMQLALNTPGNYQLTVFDGSNQGGKVAVKITVR